MWIKRALVGFRLGVLVALLLTANQAAAGPVSHAQIDQPAEPQVDLYSQLFDSTKFVSSVNRLDPVGDIRDDQAADDFVLSTCTGSCNITTITAYGRHEGSGTGVVSSFNVQFYTDDNSLPETLIYEEVISGTALSRPAVEPGNFVMTMTTPPKLANGTYWVSVQANVDFSQTGRTWLWGENPTQFFSESAWQNPPNGYGKGCINWAPRVTVCKYPSATDDKDLSFKVEGDTNGGNPKPTLLHLIPNRAPPGTPGLVLEVRGYNFVPTSVVRWAGADRVTTYVNSNRLQADVTPTDLATPSLGGVSVSVFSPALLGGDGGLSDVRPFYIVYTTLMPIVRK